MNSTGPVNFRTPNPDNPYDGGDVAAPALPGRYYAQVVVFNKGKFDTLSLKHSIELKSNSSIDAAFNQEISELRRIVSGIDAYLNYASERLPYFKAAIGGKLNDYIEVREKVEGLTAEIQQIRRVLFGETALARKEFEVNPGLSGRLDNIVYNLWSTTQSPSNTYREQLKIVSDGISNIYMRAKKVESELKLLEKKLDTMKAPATPGRLPEWKP